MAPSVFTKAFNTPPPSISKNEYVIAGILSSVYGLAELGEVQDVACLWLLHPRGDKRESMEPLAHAAISEWNSKAHKGHKQRGLICVSFDQRNHGTRKIDDRANAAWREGNPRHAPDMFGIFQGTALDTSQLIDYLPGYIFSGEEHTITSHLVLGVSLGGHAAWHCILHDHRITIAVPIIGCTDYVQLMSQRAEKSRLESWSQSNPPGSKFLGSKDFPKALQDSVDRWDPAALLMGEMISPGDKDYGRDPNAREKKKLLPLMRDHLDGKKIFNIAGGDDKLVPYACSEPFLTWLKNAIRPGGWYADHNIVLKDKAYDGAGHEVTVDMVRDALDFIFDMLVRERAAAAKI